MLKILSNYRLWKDIKSLEERLQASMGRELEHLEEIKALHKRISELG